MEYIGEHTWMGQLGTLLISIAFASAALCGASYLFSTRTESSASLRKLARGAFWIHGVSVIAIIGSLLWMLFQGWFEFDYVWKHSNNQMPGRYILSALWEGQAGSFLLWIFWHVVLGAILVVRRGKWEPYVMTVVALVQVFLVSMLLGVYVGDQKIGSNPFVLVRELPDNIGLPWTSMPDYLQEIPNFKDGRGLNPLLQNYWMTIHPPMLFLGFASVLIPFSFAIAGLWRKKLQDWIKPALPWTYFSIGALGLGILMGGAWAYEALSFGGFWAWDPVENASLVPWLTLVGAGHVMIVNRRKNNSLFSAFFLTLISFILILYSTFLTRSGVLGDTSVHSFTGEGLMGQLILYLLFFVGLSVSLLILDKRLRLGYIASSLVLVIFGFASGQFTAAITTFLILSPLVMIVTYQKHFPRAKEEEKLWSREFWIFIGSLVLLLSAIQITFETSKPVWNLLAEPFSGAFLWLYDVTGIDGFEALANGNLAPHSDVIMHYNRWQVPFAFIVLLLISVGQYFRYKNTDMKAFFRKIWLSFAISVGITALIATLMDFWADQFTLVVLLFTSVFAVAANFDYFIRIAKGRWDRAGSSLAHIGFGLLLLGALLSTGKSVKISENTTGLDIKGLSENFSNQEDILLFKGDTIAMERYFVHYKDKEKRKGDVYYEVEYFDRVKRTYQEGDRVFVAGGVYMAKEDHVAGESFMSDQEHWEFMMEPTGKDMNDMKQWNRFKPGRKLFTLEPHVQVNETFGNVAEPATKHYLNRDIYTHVRWANLEEQKPGPDGYLEPQEYELQAGDTAFVGQKMVRLDSIVVVPNDEKEKFSLLQKDLAVKAIMKIRDLEDNVYRATPLYIIRDNFNVPDKVEVPEAGLKISFTNIDPKTDTFTLQIAEKPGKRREFIVMQAILFPMINVLWIGCILMVLGTWLAVRNRMKARKAE